MAELKRYNIKEDVFGGEQIKQFSDIGRHVSAVRAISLVRKQREIMREAAECLRAWTENNTAPQADLDLIKRLEEGAGDES